MSHTDNLQTPLEKPLRLPCGAVLKNRLIKASMSDSLGDGRGNATAQQARLYQRWADGGAALSLIGEVQVTQENPEKPGNLVCVESADLTSLRKLAQAGSQNNAQIWPQLGHAGALSHAPISAPKGPSPLELNGLQCQGLSLAEIQALPSTYARAAMLAKSVGFQGVQIHAGHGFLLSQFLSPLFNHRTDAYGGSISGRFRIIGEIIEAVRAAVGPDFPIGIKINATDMLEGGLSQDEALDGVKLLDKSTIDLIDISGGTYFPGAAASSDSGSKSGPYFVEFSKRAKAVTQIPIMLTGGFRTHAQALATLSDGSADAIGLARALVLEPDLPNVWMSGQGHDPVFPRFDNPPEGAVTAWYTMRLSALATDGEQRFDMSPATALDMYLKRDTERSEKWMQKFHSA